MSINKSDIVNAIMKKTNFNKKDTNTFMDAFADTIKAAVKKHTIVRLVGLLTIKVVHRKPRKFRNPQTGKMCETEDKHVPTIKAGQTLRNLANEK